MKSRLATLVAFGLLVTACSGSPSDQTAPTSTSTTAAETSVSTTAAPAPPEDFAPFVVAEAAGDTIEIFDQPEGGQAVRTLDKADEISGKIVFLQADDVTDDRIEVFLPVRPNGSTGWVNRSDVSLSSHGFLMEIRLAEHRLVVFNGSDVVFETDIGVGTNDTPTPGGVFFIKELLQPPSPNGVYGTYAYGLSGFSTVFETFNGGNGVIGVHGTNDPSAIGSDVSAGCIRVVNDDIEMLVEDIGLPLGTPVAINA